MDRGIGFLTTKHQAREFGLGPQALSHKLIDTRARADVTTTGQRCAREQIPGLGTVDIPLQRLGVVESPNKNHLFLEILERLKDLSKFHRLTLASSPPFLRMKSAT